MTTREDPATPWTLDTLPDDHVVTLIMTLAGNDVTALRQVHALAVSDGLSVSQEAAAQIADLLRRLGLALEDRARRHNVRNPQPAYKPINADHRGCIRQMLSAGTLVERCGEDGVWRRYAGDATRLDPLDDIDLTTYVYRYQVPPEDACPYQANDVTVRELQKLVAHTGVQPFDHLSGLLSQLSNIVAVYKDQTQSVAQHVAMRTALITCAKAIGDGRASACSDEGLSHVGDAVVAYIARLRAEGRVDLARAQGELHQARIRLRQIAYLTEGYAPRPGEPLCAGG